jgi:anti-anti-sigma factor
VRDPGTDGVDMIGRREFERRSGEDAINAAPEPPSLPDRGGLDVTTERQGTDGRVILAGELDLAGADALQQAIDELRNAEVSRIVVDLQALEFMDSTGLRTLIQAHVRSEEDGRELWLIRGRESVQRVFELTRTDEVLRFESPAERG